MPHNAKSRTVLIIMSGNKYNGGWNAKLTKRYLLLESRRKKLNREQLRYKYRFVVLSVTQQILVKKMFKKKMYSENLTKKFLVG